MNSFIRVCNTGDDEQIREYIDTFNSKTLPFCPYDVLFKLNLSPEQVKMIIQQLLKKNIRPSQCIER